MVNSAGNVVRTGIAPDATHRRYPAGSREGEAVPLAGDRHPPLGAQLEPATRGWLERRLQQPLGDVRLRFDSAAANGARAVAFTVGEQVVIAPQHYRPGTFAGDSLLAHEMAHVIQQRGPASSSDDRMLERDADRATVSAVMDSPRRFLPRLRSALSLRRCEGCTDAESKALEQLRNESDPARLAQQLGGATDDQLRRLAQAVPRDTVQGEAVAWEQAVRATNFRRVSALRASTRGGFAKAYAPKILEIIESNRATIRIVGDQALRDYAHDHVTRLLALDSGFRLIVDLLATGQVVTITRAAAGTGHETTIASPEGRLRTQVTDENDPRYGAALSVSEQTRGAGAGSTIALDIATSGNQVTIGGTPDRPAAITADPTAGFGHELIHALHSARGENIGSGLPPILTGVRDPVTGQPQSPEELRTMTGQTRFVPLAVPEPGEATSFPSEFNVPSGDVTENDLRRDLGLPPRASHFGATDKIRIRRDQAATLDAIVSRYRIGSGPLPAEAVGTVRRLLGETGYTDAMMASAPPTSPLWVPHPQHVLMVIRFVERRPQLADRMEALTVQ
jgi:hypothetical protein